MERVTLYGTGGSAFCVLTADAVDLAESGARRLVLRTGNRTTSVLLGEPHTAVIETVEEVGDGTQHR